MLGLRSFQIDPKRTSANLSTTCLNPHRGLCGQMPVRLTLLARADELIEYTHWKAPPLHGGHPLRTLI